MLLNARGTAQALVAQVDAALSHLSASADVARSRLQTVSDSALSVGKVLAGAAAGFAFAQAVTGAEQLNAAAAKYQAAVGATSEEMAQAQQDAVAFFKTNTEGWDEIYGALGNIRTAFQVNEEEANKALGSFDSFAKATGQSLAGSVSSLSKAMLAWNVSVDDAGPLMDKLVRSHQLYNLNITQTESLLATMAPRLQGLGLGINDAIGLFDAFAKKGLSASQAALGLSQAIPKLQAAGLTFNDIVKKMAAAGTEAERQAIAFDYFGKRAGPALAAAIQPGMTSMADLVNQMDEVGGASDRAAQAIENSFGDRATVFIHNITGSLAAFGVQFGPLIQSATVFSQVFGRSLFTLISTGIGAAVLGLKDLITQLTTAKTAAEGLAGVQIGAGIAGGAGAGAAAGAAQAGAATGQDFIDSVFSGAEGTIAGNVFASRVENIIDPNKSTVLGSIARKAGVNLGLQIPKGIAEGVESGGSAAEEAIAKIISASEGPVTLGAAGAAATVHLEAMAAANAKLATSAGLAATSTAAETAAIETAAPATAGLGATLGGLLVPLAAIAAAVGVLAVAWANNWFHIQEVAASVINSIGPMINDLAGVIGFLADGMDKLSVKGNVVAESLSGFARIADGIGSVGAAAITSAQGMAAPLARIRDWAAASYEAQRAESAVVDEIGRHNAAEHADDQAMQDTIATLTTYTSKQDDLRHQWEKGTITLQQYESELAKLPDYIHSLDQAPAGARTAADAYDTLGASIIRAGKASASGFDLFMLDADRAAAKAKYDSDMTLAAYASAAAGVPTSILSITQAIQRGAEAAKAATAATINAWKSVADGIRGERTNIDAAMKQLETDLHNEMSAGEEYARLSGLLHGKNLAAGLHSGDPVVRAQAIMLRDEITARMDEMTGKAKAAGLKATYELALGLASGQGVAAQVAAAVGQNINKSLASASVDLSSTTEGWLNGLKAAYLNAEAASKATTAKLIADAKNYSAAEYLLNTDIEAAHHKTATTVSLASKNAASAVKTAFSQMKTAADAYFTAVHQANLQAISDSQKAADARAKQQYDAAVAQLQGPLNAAQQALKDRMAAEEKQHLIESLEDAKGQLAALQQANAQATTAADYQDPTSAMRGVRDAQQALDDYLAQQNLDTMQADVDNKIKGTMDAKTGVLQGGLDQALAAQIASDAAVAAQQTATENARFAQQKGDFDKEFKALSTHLGNVKNLHANSIKQIEALYRQFGLDVIGYGSDIPKNLIAGMKGAVGDVSDAALALAAAIAKYLKLKSPAEAGPLSDDISEWGFTLAADFAAGLQRGTRVMSDTATLFAASALDSVTKMAGPMKVAADTANSVAVATINNPFDKAMPPPQATRDASEASITIGGQRPPEAPVSKAEVPTEKPVDETPTVGLPPGQTIQLYANIEEHLYLDGTPLKDWVSKVIASELRTQAGPRGKL